MLLLTGISTLTRLPLSVAEIVSIRPRRFQAGIATGASVDRRFRPQPQRPEPAWSRRSDVGRRVRRCQAPSSPQCRAAARSPSLSARRQYLLDHLHPTDGAAQPSLPASAGAYHRTRAYEPSCMKSANARRLWETSTCDAGHLRMLQHGAFSRHRRNGADVSRRSS